ncbi:hypothetical protein ACFY64_31480 [Streptomyces collinus]|uniref:hypothetical protein n=1 Tax=Streptomyces collinus TaxID=42684 RepID=UPI0036931FB9
MLTFLTLLADVHEAVDTALAYLHEWGPLLVATTAAAIAVGSAADTVRTRVRTARALSALHTARPRSTSLTCPDMRPDTSADARPDASGHGSGGDS